MYKITICGIRPKDIHSILKAQVGQGGFQTLLRKIKGQYSEQREELKLDRVDIERLFRYAKDYGGGGFQDRILVLIDKLNIIKDDLLKFLEQ